VRRAFAEVVEPVSKATASVVVGGKQVALGVIVHDEGLILTKASELVGPASVRLSDGRIFPAGVVGCALEHDLAMLRIEGKPGRLRSVTLADSDGDPPVGSLVAAVGTTPVPMAAGVISVGRRTILADVVMGVVLQDHIMGAGARISDVTPFGGARSAGIKRDDVIIGIDDAKISDREDVTALMAKKSPGEKIVVRVRRGDEQLDFPVTLVLRPAGSPRSARQNRMGGRLSERRTGFAAVIQHDMVTLEPNQCGSAVVTLDGKVVGLTIARAGRTEAYALPADVIAPLIDDLRAGKYPPTTNPSTQPTTLPAERTSPVSVEK
jgi:serine protease Do